MKNSTPCRGLKFLQPLITQQGSKGRCGLSITASKTAPVTDLPEQIIRREKPELPWLTEQEVVRHFTRISQLNVGVDTVFYPLGSCTMKYNPRINETVARLDGFTRGHPYLPQQYIQGALELMYELENYLAEIAGLAAVTLQPAAGAHGEYTGMRIIKAALEQRGEKRTKVIVPDTAHGTNPASCTLNGFSAIEVKSSERGILTVRSLEQLVDHDTAALMVTNPNTLGLFEEEIRAIADLLHSRGAFLYLDGANMNSILGKTRPGDMGVDVMHFNLHKTFSTPHGGGGPGSGPVAVTKELEKFLPIPRVVKTARGYRMNTDMPHSIGRVRSFWGNFGVLVKAYAYIREMGAEGLTKASELAVLNANYILARLRGTYHVPYDGTCMHECVVTDKYFRKKGIRNIDICKALMDRGFHPPTVSFPICIKGALMIEPTETETPEEVDRFVEAMLEIAAETESGTQEITSAPHLTCISRPDETQAARRPVLSADLDVWQREKKGRKA